jgi:hypothetical protein
VPDPEFKPQDCKKKKKSGGSGESFCTHGIHKSLKDWPFAAMMRGVRKLAISKAGNRNWCILRKSIWPDLSKH